MRNVMIVIRLIKNIILIGALSMTSVAFASIDLNSLYDIWSEDKPMFSKTIYNNDSSKTAYVKIELLEVTNPLSENKVEKLLSSKEMAERLFVTPSRLIIPPGRSKNIRFYHPKGRSKDQISYYRVSIMPVLPKKEDGFAITDKELLADGEISAGVGIMIGFSSILVVQPQNAVYKTYVKSKEEALEIHNDGNALIEVVVKAKCKPKEERQKLSTDLKALYCDANDTFEQRYKIYPSTPKIIKTVPFANNVEIEVFENGKSTQKQKYSVV